MPPAARTPDGNAERLQARLRKLMPLYEFFDLQVEQLGDTVICGAPLSPSNVNHLGILHAGILFSLAEATGGIAVTQHREFARDRFVARSIAITYLKPARTDVRAVLRLGDAVLQAIRDGLALSGKHAFEVEVPLIDSMGEPISNSICEFQLSRR